MNQNFEMGTTGFGAAWSVFADDDDTNVFAEQVKVESDTDPLVKLSQLSRINQMLEDQNSGKDEEDDLEERFSAFNCQEEDDRWKPTIPYMAYTKTGVSSNIRHEQAGLDMYSGRQKLNLDPIISPGYSPNLYPDSTTGFNLYKPVGTSSYWACNPDPNSNSIPSHVDHSLYPGLWKLNANSNSVPSHLDHSRYYQFSSNSNSTTKKLETDDIVFSILRNTLINLTSSRLDSQMTQVFMEFFELFNPIFLEDLEKYMSLSEDIQKGLQSQSWDFTGIEVGGRGFRSPPEKKELVKMLEHILETHFKDS